jgi:hypothetical protein
MPGPFSFRPPPASRAPWEFSRFLSFSLENYYVE